MNAAEMFGHWQSVRRDLLRALDMLADEQLGFVPREGLWSLGTVACHIAEAEEGWFRYVVTRELGAWPEFAAGGYATVESIRTLLDWVHSRTEAYLATVDVVDLERIIDASWNEAIPLRWIVWHALEHEIHHRGEIYLMLGLMGMEAPDV
jgi:uncharacterized damage-inducible protein DinB